MQLRSTGPSPGPSRDCGAGLTGPRGLAATLLEDVRGSLASWPARAFLVAWLAAAAFILARRGIDFLPTLGLIPLGVGFYGFLAWYAGRSPRAVRRPDPVRAPRLEMAVVALGYLGLTLWIFGLPGGSQLFFACLVAGAAVALVARYRPADFSWLLRSWLPFLPLLLAIALPKLPLQGAAVLTATVAGLPSGVIQQLLLQVGATARIEAFTGRVDLAAVCAALLFGAFHAPLNLYATDGDLSLAFANAIVLQGAIGLAFCVGYLRHRAPLPLGFAHALLMA